jgi:hypothetical protein
MSTMRNKSFRAMSIEPCRAYISRDGRTICTYYRAVQTRLCGARPNNDSAYS